MWSFASQQRADVALQHEVRTVPELDRLDDPLVRGMDEVANLTTDDLLPLGQSVDVGVDARIGLVAHLR